MLQSITNRKGDKITGTITFDAAALGETEKPSKLQMIVQCIVATWLLLFLAGLFTIALGVPYIRWDEPLDAAKDGTVLSESDRAFTRYVTLGDSRRVHANEFADGLPSVIFIPLSEWSHGNVATDQ